MHSPRQVRHFLYYKINMYYNMLYIFFVSYRRRGGATLQKPEALSLASPSLSRERGSSALNSQPLNPCVSQDTIRREARSQKPSLWRLCLSLEREACALNSQPLNPCVSQDTIRRDFSRRGEMPHYVLLSYNVIPLLWSLSLRREG
jgi:hypothetical protein